MRNSYEPSTPRMALRLIALAMSAITLGVLVVLPAKLETVDAPRNELVQESAERTAPAAAESQPMSATHG